MIKFVLLILLFSTYSWGAALSSAPITGNVGFSDTTVSGNITVFDSVTSSLVGANGQVFYFGTPTSGSAVTLTINGIASVTVEPSGLGSGTIVIEVSNDNGAFWFRPSVYQVSTNSYSNIFTAAFSGVVNTSGCTNIRSRAITSWSGTSTMTFTATVNQNGVLVASALPQGGSSSALQTTGNSSLTSVATNTSSELTLVGPVNETAPTSDTAASGLNGRLQRIAENLTSIDAGIPTSLGSQTIANSMPVTIASNQTVPINVIPIDLVGNAPGTFTVGITSGSALATNANRKGLVITNVSVNKISIGLDGNAAVLNSGITLYPGGSWTMDAFTFTNGAISAIASAASSIIAIQEFQ